jgi:hypothetical protein
MRDKQNMYTNNQQKPQTVFVGKKAAVLSFSLRPLFAFIAPFDRLSE